MNGPSPRRILIVTAVVLAVYALLAFVVCIQDTGATDYVYANCRNVLIRAYDGPNGYVYWGQPTNSIQPIPTPGGWTANPLPYVGKATLMSLVDCRVTVRDSDGLLYLDFDGAAWSLPGVLRRVYLPIVQR